VGSGESGVLTAASKEAAGILRRAKRTASALGGGVGPEDALGNSTSTPAETAGTATHGEEGRRQQGVEFASALAPPLPSTNGSGERGRLEDTA